MKALFFWGGNDVPLLWLKCITSFYINDFETLVYSPEPEKMRSLLDRNITCINSDEILPISILHKIKQKNYKGQCYPSFADLFRAKALLANPNSWWFDTDVLCLKNVSFFKKLSSTNNGKMLIGFQSKNQANNAVIGSGNLKVMKKYAKSLFEFAESKQYVSEWGDFGPTFLNTFRKGHANDIAVLDQDIFYPIKTSEINYLYDQKLLSKAIEKTKNSLCLHLWSEVIKMSYLPLNMYPPKNSLIIHLISKNQAFDRTLMLPDETCNKLLYPPEWGLKKTLKNILPSLYFFIKRKVKKFVSNTN